ncbi:flagellar filament capping protein FliD [Peribacillus deserti]|uniref:Flagellar hook-associated protein 2 n=1 Tax=Peribacillus deserti TaxID=673318 RepID=A0A2N5M9P1_9BACI|nr:flagellar filament capping protein FliD [Peribacillus deserti]PLT31074.1 flagellar hook protein [Peribacillus deserti]
MVRISGLASGMDIDTMVKDLMKAERLPMDKMKQKKQVLEWQKEDCRSMNTLLYDFRNQLFNMKLSSSYRAKETSSSTESKVTATASASASNGSYTISKVTQLAEAATKASVSGISAGSGKVDLTKSLNQAAGQFAAGADFDWKYGSVEYQKIAVPESGKTFKLNLPETVSLKNITTDSVVQVDGKAYKVVSGKPADDNQVGLDESGNLMFLNDINKGSTIDVDYYTHFKVDELTLSKDAKEFQLSKAAINASSLNIKVGTSLTLKAIISGTTGKVDLVDEADGKTVKGSIDLDTGKVTLNDAFSEETKITASYQQKYFTFGITSHTSQGIVTEKFGVQGSESLNNVISRVNSSTAGVTMFYDTASDKMSMTRKETGNFNGEETDPEIVTDGGFINDVLKFSTAVEKGGKNAVFMLNGLETNRSSNSFEVNGVTFTLKQTFDDTVSISTKNDSQKIYDNIKGLVDKYNELIGKISSKISQERYRDFQPLSDEERESLTDKQQEQWEEKAKSGLIKRDPILSDVLNKMRIDLSTPVNSAANSLYKQLSNLGIKTTSNYLEGGKLEIDEAKLKKAIGEDPEGVEALFTANGTTSSQRGIVQRLYDSVDQAWNKVKIKAGTALSVNSQFTIGRDLNSLDTRINSFEDRLVQAEDRYYRQFTAMEKAIQKSNSQSTYLMQQFGGGY